MLTEHPRKYSIVVATYNKAWALPRVFDSILPQLDDAGELIVVDDGSTDETPEICGPSSIRYVRLNDAVGVNRNPSVARNVGYRMATGDVIIAQSDDVVHVGETVRPLVDGLKAGEFHIATVWNLRNGKTNHLYTGNERQRPLFFLGSLWRRDLYAVGGNDEDFKFPGREDVWFARCLEDGRGLRAVYRDDVVGHHLHHRHAPESEYGNGFELFNEKVSRGEFCSSGGPWT